MADKKPKKPKATALNTPAELVKALFLRPFARRMKCVCTGLTTTPGVFVLSSALGDKTQLVDPDHAAALVWVTDPALQTMLQDWLAQFRIDLSVVGELALLDLTSLLNHVKWDASALVIEARPEGHLVARWEDKAVVIWRPMPSYFVYDQMRVVAERLIAVFVTGVCPTHTVAIPSDKAPLRAVKILPHELPAPLAPEHDRPWRSVLVRGLDLLTTDHLPAAFALSDDPGSHLVLWRPDGTCYAYAGACRTDRFVLVGTRLHAMVVP